MLVYWDSVIAYPPAEASWMVAYELVHISP